MALALEDYCADLATSFVSDCLNDTTWRIQRFEHASRIDAPIRINFHFACPRDLKCEHATRRIKAFMIN